MERTYKPAMILLIEKIGFEIDLYALVLARSDSQCQIESGLMHI